jgi:hypothetical protein
MQRGRLTPCNTVKSTDGQKSKFQIIQGFREIEMMLKLADQDVVTLPNELKQLYRSENLTDLLPQNLRQAWAAFQTLLSLVTQ